MTVVMIEPINMVTASPTWTRVWNVSTQAAEYFLYNRSTHTNELNSIYTPRPLQGHYSCERYKWISNHSLLVSLYQLWQRAGWVVRSILLSGSVAVSRLRSATWIESQIRSHGSSMQD